MPKLIDLATPAWLPRLGRVATICMVAWQMTFAAPAFAADAEPKVASVGDTNTTAPHSPVRRMWRLEWTPKETEEPVVAYLLGITHPGYEFEHDRYFEEAIVPVLKQSKVLHVEGIQKEGAAKGKRAQCPLPSGATAAQRKIYMQAKQALRSMVLDYQEEVLGAMGAAAPKFMRTKTYKQNLANSMVNSTEDLRGLFEDLQFYGEISRSHRHRHDAAKANPNGYSNIVVEIMHRFPELRAVGLDSNEEFASAFCSSALDMQIFLLSELTPHHGPNYLELRKGAPGISGAYFAKVENALMSTLENEQVDSLLDTDPEGYDGIVCDRNRTWVNEMLSLKESGHFYAVGLLHLFDHHPGSPSGCPGLLNQLKADGVVVTRVMGEEPPAVASQ